MFNEKDVLQKLSQIIDPDLKKDIVSLGFIKNLTIQNSNVSFEIALTTPACPVKSEFQAAAEKLVKEIKGVSKVNVQMSSQSNIQKPQATVLPQSTLQNVETIIAVSSCKGGVGKSTVAAYLAKEIAQRGFRVGLMDADIYGPSIPTLFNLAGRQIYVNDKQQLLPVEIDNLKIMSFGFLLGEAPAVMRGPIVSRYIQQLIHQTDWGRLDYFFIDTPRGTGDFKLPSPPQSV